MAADSDTSGLNVRRANRRGFLMGVTLAELMLITLFVLLLLLEAFGQLEEDLGGPEAVDATRKLAERVKVWAEQQERSLPEIWRNLIPREEGSSSELVEQVRAQLARKTQELTEAKQRLAQADRQRSELKSDLSEERSRNRSLKVEIADSRKELATAQRAREQAVQQLEQEQSRRGELESELQRAKTQIEESKDDTAGAKEGGLVLCVYEPPVTPSASHGKSVALGTVHLQHDGIALIHKNVGLRNLEVVDKVGDPYDLTDALDQLDSWPLGTKRTFEDFRSWGEEFVRIGDREARRRQKCRFSMGYYIDEGVHPNVLTGVFERYFFKQPSNSITKEEFERLVNSVTNVDSR